MGWSGAVRVRRRNFFHRHHILHLNWLILCISKSFSKFSADRLRLQTHSRFKRSYDKYNDIILLKEIKSAYLTSNQLQANVETKFINEHQGHIQGNIDLDKYGKNYYAEIIYVVCVDALAGFAAGV